MGRHKQENYSNDIINRTLKGAALMLSGTRVIRDIANELGVSHQTVYTDLSQRLRRIDNELFLKVKAIMKVNKQERLSRGVQTNRNRCMFRKMYNTMSGNCQQPCVKQLDTATLEFLHKECGQYCCETKVQEPTILRENKLNHIKQTKKKVIPFKVATTNFPDKILFEHAQYVHVVEHIKRSVIQDAIADGFGAVLRMIEKGSTTLFIIVYAKHHLHCVDVTSVEEEFFDSHLVLDIEELIKGLYKDPDAAKGFYPIGLYIREDIHKKSKRVKVY